MLVQATEHCTKWRPSKLYCNNCSATIALHKTLHYKSAKQTHAQVNATTHLRAHPRPSDNGYANVFYPRWVPFPGPFYIWWICRSDGPPDIIVTVHPILLRWVHTHSGLYALTLKVFQTVHSGCIWIWKIFWEIFENHKLPGRGLFEIYTSYNQVAFPIWCFPSIFLCFIWWNENMFWMDAGSKNLWGWNGIKWRWRGWLSLKAFLHFKVYL